MPAEHLWAHHPDPVPEALPRHTLKLRHLVFAASAIVLQLSADVIQVMPSFHSIIH